MLARFLSADTVVPGNAMGGMDGVASRPLTVAFHEAGFAERLNAEDALGLPFAQDDRTRQQAGTPWGPRNPQALNRYSYVQNNPVRYVDPSGHATASYTFTLNELPLLIAKIYTKKDDVAAFWTAMSVLGGAAATVICAELGPISLACGAVVAMGVAAAGIDANDDFNRVLEAIAYLQSLGVETFTLSIDTRTGIVIVEGRDNAGKYQRKIVEGVQSMVAQSVINAAKETDKMLHRKKKP